MVAQALRFKQFGWSAPRVSAFGATVNGTAMVVPFTQDTPVAGAVTIASLTCLVNGVTRGITVATVAGANLNITLASAVTAGQTVRLSYSGSGAAPLQDAAGDLVPAFSIDVRNTTP